MAYRDVVVLEPARLLTILLRPLPRPPSRPPKKPPGDCLGAALLDL